MNKLMKIGTVVTVFLASNAALAQDGTAMSTNSWYAIAAAFLLATAAALGTTAQGRAACSALEGMARNPAAADKLFTPMILGLALIESLVIFSFVLSILILGKIA